MHINSMLGPQCGIGYSQSQYSLGNPEKLLWDLRSCPSPDLLLSIKEIILGTNRPINLQDKRNRFLSATR